LSNGFSRKLANHAAAIALHYFAYNFIKIHRTLRNHASDGGGSDGQAVGRGRPYLSGRHTSGGRKERRSMSIPEQVASFLRKHGGVAYCDDCLKENVPLKRRQQAQRVTGALAQTQDFIRDKGVCAECGGDKLVTRTKSK
jgi:hypothetical protein